MKVASVVLVASVIGLSGCETAYLIGSNLNPSRFMADADTRSLCEKNGGIRVYRKIPLEVGRFPTVIPEIENPREWIKKGVIYGKYRYEETRTYQKLHGYPLSRYRTTITDISDDAVIGEVFVTGYKDVPASLRDLRFIGASPCSPCSRESADIPSAVTTG